MLSGSMWAADTLDMNVVHATCSAFCHGRWLINSKLHNAGKQETHISP